MAESWRADGVTRKVKLGGYCCLSALLWLVLGPPLLFWLGFGFEGPEGYPRGSGPARGLAPEAVLEGSEAAGRGVVTPATKRSTSLIALSTERQGIASAEYVI